MIVDCAVYAEGRRRDGEVPVQVRRRLESQPELRSR
jgi:hypothetical protein